MASQIILEQKILEQNLAVNPFGKQIEVDRKPENNLELELMGDKIITAAIEQYNRIRSEYLSSYKIQNNSASSQDESTDRRFDNEKYLVFTPTQIMLIMCGLLKYKESNLVERYIAKLIQTSYDAGYNNFKIESYDSQLAMIGNNLKGTKNKPLEITMEGDRITSYQSSDYCNYKIIARVLGIESYFNHCNLDIEGDVLAWGVDYKRNSTFKIKGNAYSPISPIIYPENCKFEISGNASEIGTRSKNCEFYVGGNVTKIGRELLQAEQCTFIINTIELNETGRPWYAKECIFKTANHQTYLQTLSKLKKGNNNNVTFIGDKGSMIKQELNW